MKTNKIMGGDPTLMRAARLDPAFAQLVQNSEVGESIEVPCQDCGRMVLLAPSGQRVALGEPESLVELDRDSLAENRVASVGPTMINEGSAAVVCMWCALAGGPGAVLLLDQAVADAKRKLGEV